MYAKATQRKQGKTESVVTYINQMRLIFDAMSEPISEQFKVFLIKQTLHPRYTAIVASHCPKTVGDLMRIAREVENTRPYEPDSSAKIKPKYRSANAVTKAAELPSNSDGDHSSDDEAGQGKVAAAKIDKKGRQPDKKRASAPAKEETTGNVEVACFICGSPDHLQRQCKQKWPKHCFRCGMPDVVLRDCKNCNSDTPKNAKVNSAAEQQSSSSQ